MSAFRADSKSGYSGQHPFYDIFVKKNWVWLELVPVLNALIEIGHLHISDNTWNLPHTLGGSIQEFLVRLDLVTILNGLNLNWTFTYSRTIYALGLVIVLVVSANIAITVELPPKKILNLSSQGVCQVSSL